MTKMTIVAVLPSFSPSVEMGGLGLVFWYFISEVTAVNEEEPLA